MRIDPEQRFTCRHCARCCHRFAVVVSTAEVERYRRHNAAAWFRGPEDSSQDPFEPVPGIPALRQIRKRADGACGFLSPDNRCRIHEELGAASKPLTCRLFPYAMHGTPDHAVVTASFGCPTVVANEGALISTGAPRDELEALRKEWFQQSRAREAGSLELVKGRAIDPATARVLRENLLAMLKRQSGDIREDIRRIGHVLDDLTRNRVLALGEHEFAEYVSLTVPYAASRADAPASRAPSAIGRLLQYGFLYVVCATRQSIEARRQSRMQMRLARLRMLAHFHHLGPSVDRVDVRGLKRRPVDINAPGIRPVVYHFLRSTLETLGAHQRPLLDELAIAVSYLNSACALASMQADAVGHNVDRDIFIEALMEASDFSHASGSGVVDWVLKGFSARTDSLWCLAAAQP